MTQPGRPTLDQVFSAIADPTRRRILAMLLEDDMAVTDVADPFEMSLAAISKHLAILTRAGLISQERRGRITWCRLEPDALREASVWMQGFGQFEPVNLEAFERFLRAELGLPPEDDIDLPDPDEASPGEAPDPSSRPDPGAGPATSSGADPDPKPDPEMPAAGQKAAAKRD